jgi:hypothetical protein
MRSTKGGKKMMRRAANKVMWVGRATVFVVGLSVIMALVLGMATAAFGANGDFFKVGKSNFASAVSVLDKSGAGPALRLVVDSGAPLAVNSPTKVTNLNSDKLDGHDAPLWANINPDGSTTLSFGVTSSEKQGGSPGRYKVSFDRDVSRCAYVATLGDSAAGIIVPGEISTTSFASVGDPNSVFVQTFNSDGIVNDKPFHLAVLC